MSSESWVTGHRPTHHAKPSPVSFLAEINAPDWMDEGLCAQTDPEAFFPEKGGSVREAKAVCAICDVREQCLAYAIDQGERFGIWGGLSDVERRRIKRDPTAAPRACRRDTCTETIPASAHSGRRYHSIECGNLARQERLMAALDHPPIIAAYLGGASVTVLAKRHKVPVTVISRILDDNEVRRMRGRRPNQAAS